jgi:hypothetical protein
MTISSSSMPNRPPLLTPEQIRRSVSDALTSCIGYSTRNEIEQFDGEKSLNAKVWLKDFKLWSKARGYNDDKRFECFELFLKDHAKVWFDYVMNKRPNPPTDWFELEQEFLRKFLPSDQKKELRKIMEKRKQCNEYVDQYLTHKHVLCLDYKPNMKFDELNNYLIEGLHDDIKAPLVASDPASLQELVNNANKIEEGLKLANKLTYNCNITHSNIEKTIEEIKDLISKLCTEHNIARERLDKIEMGYDEEEFNVDGRVKWPKVGRFSN